MALGTATSIYDNWKVMKYVRGKEISQVPSPRLLAAIIYDISTARQLAELMDLHATISIYDIPTVMNRTFLYRKKRAAHLTGTLGCWRDVIISLSVFVMTGLQRGWVRGDFKTEQGVNWGQFLYLSHVTSSKAVVAE
ncbi:hypothetical protein Bbelb_227570 [Branchiostoma belcheri]|nr:hypothetical protein Bbelb_227570 [Branchiostoma belcheri]